MAIPHNSLFAPMLPFPAVSGGPVLHAIGMSAGPVTINADAKTLTLHNLKPVATFFWVQTFPLKIYAPAILPMMAVYVSLAMEVMGTWAPSGTTRTHAFY